MTRVSSWLHVYCLSTCAFMISKVHVPGHGLRGVSLGQLSGLSGGRGGGCLQGGSGLVLPDDWSLPCGMNPSPL